MTVISPTGHHGTIGKHHWDTQRRWGIWNEIWNMWPTMTRALANTNWVSTYLCVCMSMSISLSVHMWDFPGNYSRCRLVALEGCFSTKNFKGGQFSNSIKECHHVQTTFFCAFWPLRWGFLEVCTLGGAGHKDSWVCLNMGDTPHWEKGSPSVLQRFGWKVVRAFWLGEIRWFLSPTHLFVSDEIQYVELCRPECCCLKPRPSVVNYG
jgi:hypothetical protein